MGGGGGQDTKLTGLCQIAFKIIQPDKRWPEPDYFALRRNIKQFLCARLRGRVSGQAKWWLTDSAIVLQSVAKLV